MKKLVVVADDFGLCRSVNQGIIESCKNDIVTELSLMLGSPGTDQAVRLANEMGGVNLGIHMLLKNWRDTGALVRRADYIRLFDELNESEIAKLVATELAEFEQVVGRKPTHITSQFGIIGHPKALASVIEYAVRYDTPMRQPVMTLYGDEFEPNQSGLALMRAKQVRTTDKIFAHILGDDYDALVEQYKRDLETLGENETAEIVLHPGYVDAELRGMTSLADERARDLRLTMDGDLRKWIEAQGVEVVGYDKI